MHILFSSLAHYGHIFPMLPLAVAAARRGHRVGYAVDKALHPTLSALGLEPIAAGISLAEAFGRGGEQLFGAQVDRQEMTPAQAEHHVMVTFGSVLPRSYAADLGEVFTRFRPDLLVYDSVCPGAAVAAELAGIPALCHGLGHRELNTLTPEYVSQVHEFAAGLGLDLSPGDLNPLGHPYLDIYPPSLQDQEFRAEARRIELRPVPFAQPGGPPVGLRLSGRTRPLIYLTLGTEAGAEGAGDVLRQAVRGLAVLDADVLVAVGPKLTLETVGPVPENVFLRSWVPQADLLPHLDLVVHHAGSGTTLGSLSHGLPQLVMPRGADQFINARLILTAGAGERLLPAEFTFSAVTEIAARLMAGKEYREAAGRISREIALMPSPTEVATRLPDLVAELKAS
ncbi:glycosyltransferase [Parafrankia sp. FMc2]|uniref:glycosyltransferase n=1 Tax=Parafrankia sp. FMc2 TaxID=3233196 RepID=UPI0034D75ED5